MDGEILVGEHAGKQLSQLSNEQLKAFAEELKGTDRESSVLLQAYLLRSGTQGFQGAEDFKPGGFADLSKDEAYSVLGLEPGASEQDIIKAHKRLMQRLHPDRGGSDYLAAKINSAKDKLI
jgi:DnaJ-domain-containing protein 1